MKNHDRDNINSFKNVREVIVEKNKGFSIYEVLFIIFITLFFGFFIGYFVSNDIPKLGSSSEIDEVYKVYDEIRTNYYSEFDNNKLLDSTINGMISSLDDEYSNFINYKEIDSFTYIISFFKAYGIIVTFENNNIVVAENFNDNLDINYGSVITNIAGIQVDKYSINDLCLFLKKYTNDSIKVSIKSDYDISEIILQDKIVEDVSVFSKKFDNIGFLKIATFDKDTFKQFVSELNKLEHEEINSLIIDIRDNYGGLTGQVNSILDFFISKGSVLYKVENRGKVTPIVAKNKNSRNYPIILLVNNNTASAAEILAAGLRDNYVNVKLLGTNTYGKGKIQKEISLSTGSVVRLTTKSWRRSNNTSIDKIGLKPDIVIDDKDLQVSESIKILKEIN